MAFHILIDLHISFYIYHCHYITWSTNLTMTWKISSFIFDVYQSCKKKLDWLKSKLCSNYVSKKLVLKTIKNNFAFQLHGPGPQLISFPSRYINFNGPKYMSLCAYKGKTQMVQVASSLLSSHVPTNITNKRCWQPKNTPCFFFFFWGHGYRKWVSELDNYKGCPRCH